MKTKKRIILYSAAATAITAYAIFVLSYVQKERNAVVCTSLEVNVISEDGDRFITKDDIAASLLSNDLNYFGRKINELPLAAMEDFLSRNRFVKSVNVYASAADKSGILHADIVQRVPILRIYADGGDFYIDDEGYVFALEGNYACYVPIVSGNIRLPFHRDFTGSLHRFLATADNAAADSAMLLLYEFGLYLKSHPFWNAQIEQIYFAAPHSIELTPRVGAHIIKMGTISDYRYKLRKLLSFYRKALPLKGWNYYKVIDLSYGSQIVCQKK